MGKRPGNLFSRQRQALKDHIIEADNDRLNNNLKKSSRMKNSTDSLRKMKKRGVIRQMLEKFPKPNHSNNNNSNLLAFSNNHIDSNQNTSNNVDEDEEEPIYESRKLLIRQMQGMIAKEVLKDRKGTVGSEYDSWSDLEENFARAYEPIPLNIRMETLSMINRRRLMKTFQRII